LCETKRQSTTLFGDGEDALTLRAEKLDSADDPFTESHLTAGVAFAAQAKQEQLETTLEEITVNKNQIPFVLVTLLAIPVVNAFGQVPPAIVEATKGAFNVPTNVPGIMTTLAPPADFNPVTATDEELASFGFPPRPDAQLEPKAHRSWVRAMNASKTRVNAQVEVTSIFHGPDKRNSHVENGLGYSSNWSGATAFGGATSYNHSNSFYFVVGEYVIPKGGFCANTHGWNYSSSWVGIDGYNSGDVLQTGTESDEYCTTAGAQPSSTYYSAWIEWYPFSSSRISSTTFPVAPGDDMFVEVWNTTATQGYAYLVDYQRNIAVEYSLTPPAGTSLVGNSAEWILEAPTVSGSLASLTNYISDYFSNCYAYTWGGLYYYPSTSNSVLLDMSTNGTSTGVISYPTLQGSSSLWLQDTGVAR
jgi:Peptidase A4 family